MTKTRDRGKTHTRGIGPADPATAVEPRPAVTVRSLVKRFRREDGSIVRAIDDVSFDVHQGEFLVLLGPSGCGKTTLLRSIAGLERPDTGTIKIQDDVVFSSADLIEKPPQRRKLSMIFQSYALWPHMTTFENVAYPLRSRKQSKSTIKARVHQALTQVGIPELATQYPGQISGGQQQRVALARALVSGDNLVLLDEPLSNVDAKVREQLRVELVSMQRELGFSAVYVTHDQVEALELGHRIAVMRHGRIAQLGTPREIYEQPQTRYVADFIGTANQLPGRVVAPDGAYLRVVTEIGELVGTAGVESLQIDDEVVVVCRPERVGLVVGGAGAGGANSFDGTVFASLFAGAHTADIVVVGETRFRVWRSSSQLLDEGQPVRLDFDPAHLRVLPHAEPESDAPEE